MKKIEIDDIIVYWDKEEKFNHISNNKQYRNYLADYLYKKSLTATINYRRENEVPLKIASLQRITKTNTWTVQVSENNTPTLKFEFICKKGKDFIKAFIIELLKNEYPDET